MPLALMLDDEKKVAGRIRPKLRSAHINLTSTEEEETFFKSLVKDRPDVVFMSYSSLNCSVRVLKTLLTRVRRANPTVPALLLVPGNRDLRELETFKRERLFDVVRCQASFAKEMTFRTERLLDLAKSMHDLKATNRLKRSFVRNELFKHLVPQLHSPETGRIDAARVSDMFAVPLSRVAEMLNAKAAAVHKTPDAPSLQEKLSELERIAAGLMHLTGSLEGLRIWLNASNQDLGGKTPLELLAEGKADVVGNILEDVLLGHPA
jgi:response regulator RpfG family c-di-GMP phosphodiesterase